MGEQEISGQVWLLMCKHCITLELCRDNVDVCVCVWSVVRLRVCVECGCVCFEFACGGRSIS